MKLHFYYAGSKLVMSVPAGTSHSRAWRMTLAAAINERAK